jgi:hypothetical protein
MGERDRPQSRKSIEEERLAQNAICQLIESENGLQLAVL